jgi:hypothetical protein
MRRDLILHFIIWLIGVLICNIILHKVYPDGLNYTFRILMLLGILKEYGIFNIVYKIIGKDCKESKDVDDVFADYIGLIVGQIIFSFIV